MNQDAASGCATDDGPDCQPFLLDRRGILQCDDHGTDAIGECDPHRNDSDLIAVVAVIVIITPPSAAVMEEASSPPDDSSNRRITRYDVGATSPEPVVQGFV